MELKGLDDSLISDLLAGSRTRNAYGPKLIAFCDSDEAAVNVAETWPEFAGKKATTLYQGFRNASEKAELQDVIQILNRNDNVFLMHNERVKLVVAAQAANGNGNGKAE